MSAAVTMPGLHPDLERVALLGWRLTPVWPNRAGCFKGYLQAATTDLDQVERWQYEFAGCNWSVVPEGSGVWALDVDVPSANHKADGWTALQELRAKHPAIPALPHGRSGGGGHLLVFRDAGHPIKCESGAAVAGIDPKARRVQFTIAPSVHGRTKRAYRWEVAPWEVAPPVAPDWLLRLFAPPPERARPTRPVIMTEDRARRTLARAIDQLMRTGAGGRNAALNRAAFTAGGLVGANKLGEQEAVVALYAAGRHLGLDDLECRATIRSGLRAGTSSPLSDRG